jgi:large subunit ribosomal protein L25
MTNTDIVHVQARESCGSRSARKLRSNGLTPVVLYGHGEATVNLAIPSEEIAAMLRHGGRVVELQGAATGSAFVRDVQWDALGSGVLHLDLSRVSAGELIQMMVPIELRGDAPGTHHGGVVQLLLHEVEISCPVSSIPEKLQLNINALELDQSITLADLPLPSGAQALGEPTDVVVQCVEAAAEEELEAVSGSEAEPEVIGRKAAQEEGEE